MEFFNNIINCLESNITVLADWAAVVIALSALFVSLQQGFQQRKHDRLSVKPHLDTFEHSDLTDKVATLTLTLSNNGLGPAIIKSHRVVKGHPEDDDYEEVDLRKEMEDALEIISIHTINELKDNYAFTAGQSMDYFNLSFQCENNDSLELIIDFIYQFNIEIEFESLYGQSFTFTTHPYTRDRQLTQQCPK